MANDNKASGRISIIESIKSPLGFFTLGLLVLEGILIGASALTTEIEMWMPLALLGLVIVLVFVIVMVKPNALYPPSSQQTPIKSIKLFFHFPDEDSERLPPKRTDYRHATCSYLVYSVDKVVIPEKQIVIHTDGDGGAYIHIEVPNVERPEFEVRLEHEGHEWVSDSYSLEKGIVNFQ